MNTRVRTYTIVIFLTSVLLLAPASALTPINAASPNSNENSQKNSNPHAEPPGQIKKLLDKYPNTTPMQEKIKKGIDIMKNGDPTKPKSNNGKKDPKHIPELKAEVSVEELKKNGKLVGKTIKTKTTLTFKNKEQKGQTDEQWNRVGFEKNWIDGLEGKFFVEMCNQSKGKITSDGEFCDVSKVFKDDINSKLAEINNRWMDDDFYLLEGGDLETAKEEAKKRGVFPIKIKDNNGKQLGHKDNDFFKSNSNPKGLDISSRIHVLEFEEETIIDFTETLKSIPDDADLSNFPIIPTSQYLQEPQQTSQSDFLDFTELILPKAEAQVETETISKFAMMGFTFAPPKIDYKVQFSDKTCFTITYPTGLHITWGGFLGLEITHFHVHFASEHICLEIVFVKLFVNVDIAAGFRMPVEVIFENVPKSPVFPDDEFTIDIFLKGRDFTVQEYVDFCNNTDIKNDFFLKLSSGLGANPCERFAFPNFFFSSTAVSGEGIGSVDFGTLVDADGNLIEIDGDEAIIKFKAGAGFALKFINRTIDACKVINLFANCIFGYNLDVGLQCTNNNISNLDTLQYILLILQDYPVDFTDRLKDFGYNCASFATPVGVGTPLFTTTLGIPADCTSLDELVFPKPDFGKPSLGPFAKPNNDDKVQCEEPSAKCWCTNGIIKEFSLPGPFDLRFGIGVGAALALTINGGVVTSDLTVSGDALPITDEITWGAGGITATIPDNSVAIPDGCIVSGAGGIDLASCFNSEIPNLKFTGVGDGGNERITITPSADASTGDKIRVSLNNFQGNLAGFSVSAAPEIQLTGTFVSTFTSFFGPLALTLPGITFGISGDTGFPIDQHARTGPVFIEIPVDAFGAAVKLLPNTQALGALTLVSIPEPTTDPSKVYDISNDLNMTAPFVASFPIGETTITWTITDITDPSNPVTRIFTQLVIVEDTNPPEISAPDDVEVEFEAFLTNTVIGFASATDIIDSSLTFSLAYKLNEALDFNHEFTLEEVGIPFEGGFPIGATIVNWTATDDSGNIGIGNQTVTVVDTTPPMIMAPHDLTGDFVEFIEGFQANVLFGFAIVMDIFDMNPEITTDKEGAEVTFTCADGTDLEDETEDPTCDDGAEPEKNMIANFVLGETTVVWTATDEFGNSASDDQEIFVTIIGDENLNFIQDILEVDGFLCDVDTVPCPFSFTSGNVTISGVITDRGDKLVVVLVPENSEAITIGTGFSESEDPAKIIVCDELATINLDSNEQVAVICGSVTVVGILGINTVEYHVGEDIATVFVPDFTGVKYDDFFFNLDYIVGEDNTMNQPAEGNFKGENFVLSEENPTFNLDKIPPEFQANSFDLPATDPFGTIVNYEITETDNLDPNPVVVCNPTDGSLFPMAPVDTVNCTVTDTSENQTPGSFTVTIFLGTETFDGLNLIIDSMGLPQNNVKSLTKLVDASSRSFEKGNNGPSINILNAFKKIVDTQTGKKISEDDAATLLNAANLVIEQLELLESANLQSATLDNSQSEIIGFDENSSLVPSSNTNNNSVEPDPQLESEPEPQLESTEQVQDELSEQTTGTSDNSDQPTRGNQNIREGDSNVQTDVASFFTLTNDSTPPDAQTTEIVTDDKTGGGGDEHLTRPTFGLSHENYETIVDSGFRFNDQSFTINDNFHTPFTQQTVNIGEVNSFEAKIYADKRLKVQEFLFGIPNVGEAHLAELGVEVWYDYNGEIEEVKAVQKSKVIDKETIVATHEKTKCQATDSEEKCDTTNVSMVFLEPLKDKVMAVKAIDYKGRYQITYLNEGVNIAGESLNPMQTYLIPSNIRDQLLIKVTQLAKYSPYWESDDGRLFEMNSFGSFKEINITFERFQDTGTAYTRLHSGFGGVMAYELKRATGIFDASELISELPDYIPYSPPVISERMTEEMKQKMIEQEEIAKKIIEESKVQARW